MKVRLYIRVKAQDGSRPFCDPVWSKNQQLIPLSALVSGKKENHPEGQYYLRYLKNGKRIWQSVGTDSQEALRLLHAMEAHLKNASKGVPSEEPVTKGLNLEKAGQTYLKEMAPVWAASTATLREYTIRLFQGKCPRKSIEAITREDVLEFRDHLLDEEEGLGMADGSVKTHMTNLKAFLRHFERPWPLKKTDNIRVGEKAVSAYSPQEISALLSVATPDEQDLIQFLLCTGVRREELTHATWADVSLHEARFQIRKKPKRKTTSEGKPVKRMKGWQPKDKDEGFIPIPDYLVDMLAARRARYPQSRLIFELASAQPEKHVLLIIKRLALKAGLNCGECHNAEGLCCDSHPICGRFLTHRFRKNFATMHHENGVSARKIQAWLKHSSLATTLRYLADVEDKSQRTKDRVNGTFAAFAPARRREMP